MVVARGCGYAPIGAGTGMAMGLDRMRDTGMMGQVRLRANVLGMMVLVKDHGHMLDIETMAQEILLANAADSELAVEQEILPGTARRFVVEAQERQP